MLVLGIETSCDETACAIVKNGRTLLSNSIASQIALHRKTGGIVPEVAAREHVVNIIPALEAALKKARCKLADIDAVAVTAGPGLLSSLLIGVNAAATLALILKKPLIPVNHIEGHIYANWIKVRVSRSEGGGQTSSLPAGEQARALPQFPIAVLTVSGGHNELILWKGHGNYTFLGATLDDAAGEAFDKVARLLGLRYPGGPEIQKVAEKGNPDRYRLPRAWVTDWNFSFSGLKTAVLYLIKKKFPRAVASFHDSRFSRRLPPQFIADVAASFQESVCEVLATKLINAAKKYKVKEVHLAGGVSANLRLRQWVEKLLPPGMRLRFCTDLSLCTDNAAMIAAAGFYKFRAYSAYRLPTGQAGTGRDRQGRAGTGRRQTGKKNPALYKLYKKWRPIIPDPNLEIQKW